MVEIYQKPKRFSNKFFAAGAPFVRFLEAGSAAKLGSHSARFPASWLRAGRGRIEVIAGEGGNRGQKNAAGQGRIREGYLTPDSAWGIMHLKELDVF
jgi:hypothetical protein